MEHIAVPHLFLSLSPTLADAWKHLPDTQKRLRELAARDNQRDGKDD